MVKFGQNVSKIALFAMLIGKMSTNAVHASGNEDEDLQTPVPSQYNSTWNPSVSGTWNPSTTNGDWNSTWTPSPTPDYNGTWNPSISGTWNPSTSNGDWNSTWTPSPTPDYNGTWNPSVSGSSTPSTSGTWNPSVSGTWNPSVSGTWNPSVSGSSNPSTSGTWNPSVSGTWNPSSDDGVTSMPNSFAPSTYPTTVAAAIREEVKIGTGAAVGISALGLALLFVYRRRRNNNEKLKKDDKKDVETPDDKNGGKPLLAGSLTGMSMQVVEVETSPSALVIHGEDQSGGKLASKV